MANPFVGQITLFPYNFAPTGWAFCAGQLLPISQYTALFSLLGVQFGGNGTSNFQLPDLRGRAPIGQGQGPGLSNYNMGGVQGAEAVTLTTGTTPAHSHGFPAFAVAATTNAPAGALPAEGQSGGRGGGPVNTYTAPGAAVSLAAGQVVPVTTGGTAHNNLQPYLTANWCIALQGIFPARN
jgi:microcystin-dependent protein